MEFDLVIPEEMGRSIRDSVFAVEGREGWIFGLSRVVRVGNSLRFIMVGTSSVDEEDYDCRAEAGLTLTAEASSRFNLASVEAAVRLRARPHPLSPRRHLRLQWARRPRRTRTARVAEVSGAALASEHGHGSGACSPCPAMA